MTNFLLKDQDFYQLNSVIKKYTFDQDKFIHPRTTFKNTYNTIRKVYPEKKLNLKEIKLSSELSAFDFGDDRINSHGKGVTKHQSKASAIMEYSERFAWVNFDFQNTFNYRKTSFNKLRKHYDIEGVEKAFYIAYSKKKEDLFKLALDIPVDWVQGYSLTKNKLSYYPANWHNNYVSSNGLAAGNIKEEAILQGLCEVIERHNVSTFILELEKIQPELIDIKSIDHEIVKKLLKSFDENNLDVYLINASNALNVPTILAMCIDKKPSLELTRVGFGYGCHTDPIKAIIRALSEYYQLREGILNQKDRIPSKFQFNKGNWQFILNINIEKILNNSKVISYKNLPDLSNEDIREEILALVDILEKKDFETIVINKTHPKLGIPVCRIFVPGFLQGTTISTIHENDDLLMILAYYQGGLIDKANEYYRKNFESFVRNLDLSLKIYYPSIDSEMALKCKIFSPELQPLTNFCRGNYIEQNSFMYYFGLEQNV